MPRELITIQIGQCGNQIGCRFWDLALSEHANHTKDGMYDDALSTFFRNVDSRYEDCPDVKNLYDEDDSMTATFDDPFRYRRQNNTAGRLKKQTTAATALQRNKTTTKRKTGFSSNEAIRNLKARAILVDMEQGVINQLLADKNLGELFDDRALIGDVSGSGNNWAHGHEVYGHQYADTILEKVRRSTEVCDSLQSFFLLHSMGGGTGSGLGTYILKLLKDNYEDVYRFTTAVFPSEDDDVITSPYNSVLALRELADHADCVLPIDNQSLFDLTNRANRLVSQSGRFRNRGSSSVTYDSKTNITTNAMSGDGTQTSKGKPFDQMNNIAANLLTNLTCSMRFEGSLNVDLNEITMNLVPFPRLHFLLSSLSPLVMPKDVNYMSPRNIDAMFTDAIHKDYQLMTVDPRYSRYLAMGLIVRGNVPISDINRNIVKLRREIDMIHWNEEGFKVGSCSVPPVNQAYSLLCLSNNCCIGETFSTMSQRFMKLYKKKTYVHHYTKYMDQAVFDESLESIHTLIDEYSMLQNATPPDNIPRFVPEI